MAVDDAVNYNNYLTELESASNLKEIPKTTYNEAFQMFFLFWRGRNRGGKINFTSGGIYYLGGIKTVFNKLKND